MKLCPRCQKQFSDDANFCPVDAARLVPVETQAAAVDALAAKFELGEPLGGRRTGAVYRATDKATGQPAAVKIIAPAVVALPGLAQRLERELKQLERVASASVARVLASGKRGDDPWVALELLDGVQTLGDAVAARGAMPIDKAARLIEIIGEALIEAAQVGVVHRDLAPKNVVFAGDDVKLLNFSLPVPTSDKVPGVAGFVAPEQYDGKQVDQRSNLYSLGALYYFVLTAQPVQVDGNGVVVPPSALAEVPGPVEAVILRALDKSPTRRFLTVRQFIDEVARVARGEPGLRSTQPLGRAGKQPAELVQTLVDANPLAMSEAGGTGTILGVGTLKPPAAPAPERSPWAPPPSAAPDGHGPPVPPEPAPATAAPASPGVAPPIGPGPIAMPTPLAAPVVSPLLAAKGKAGDDPKGKFRDTMWFKKGELDSQAAQAAADEHARTGNVTPDTADQLPIDERYKDDGSLSHTDKQLYSLRTGATQSNTALRDPATQSATDKVSEDALIDEMKGGRSRLVAIIAVVLAVVAVLVFLIAR
jgi:eukaryotic-like serine/threonine-protein kinase